MRLFLSRAKFAFKNYTLWEIFRKVFIISVRVTSDLFYRNSLFLKRYSGISRDPLKRVPLSLSRNQILDETADLEFVTSQYLKNHFNLLSGDWVDLSCHKKRELSGNVLGEEYQFDNKFKALKWDEDWISGYRWSTQKKYHQVKYSLQKQDDIKYPWELGRLQFVVRLLLASSVLEGEVGEKALKSAQDHLVDFIRENPYGYGLQWSCTMDVAIRAANMALFCMLSDNNKLHSGLQPILLKSIEQHVGHILHNLEWNDTLTSNHYLANLVGLIVCLQVLPKTKKNVQRLKFASLSFIDEINIQFDQQGVNFEGSTCYHRLSSEMMLYGWVFLSSALNCPKFYKALNDSRLPAIIYIKYPLLAAKLKSVSFNVEELDKVFAKVSGAFRFLKLCSDRWGGNIQIGDNDNGRFFWLDFRCTQVSADSPKIETLANHTLNEFMQVFAQSSERPDSQVVLHVLSSLKKALELPEKIAQDSVRSDRFTDFGLYLLEKQQMKLFVRAGKTGQLGNGGHNHNDQLSLVFHYEDIPFIVDPGTYMYTRIAKVRNEFRSTQMHNTLYLAGLEQNRWLEGPVGLFNLVETFAGKVVSCDSSKIVGCFENNDYSHKRELSLSEGTLEIIDHCSREGASLALHFPHYINVSKTEYGVALTYKVIKIDLLFPTQDIVLSDYFYSPSYGIKENAKKISVKLAGNELRWQIKKS